METYERQLSRREIETCLLPSRTPRRLEKRRFRKTVETANRPQSKARSRFAAKSRIVLLDPYGTRTTVQGGGPGGVDADFGFTGHYYHAASGLYLAPYRAYDPALGRWLSRDPIAEKGGLNLYAYCYNDPVRFTDPLGLDTYTQNRLIGTPTRTSNYNPISHTFIFTTNPDGSLADTYSWGNSANPRGWNKNCSEDRKAAQDALDANKLNKVGDSSLDPYIDPAFDDFNKPSLEHDNHWIQDNCKTAARDLINYAKQAQQSDNTPTGGWDN